MGTTLCWRPMGVFRPDKRGGVSAGVKFCPSANFLNLVSGSFLLLYDSGVTLIHFSPISHDFPAPSLS